MVQIDPRAAGPWSFWLEMCSRSGADAFREGKSLGDNPWTYFVEREYWAYGFKVARQKEA